MWFYIMNSDEVRICFFIWNDVGRYSKWSNIDCYRDVDTSEHFRKFRYRRTASREKVTAIKCDIPKFLASHKKVPENTNDSIRDFPVARMWRLSNSVEHTNALLYSDTVACDQAEITCSQSYFFLAVSQHWIKNFFLLETSDANMPLIPATNHNKSDKSIHIMRTWSKRSMFNKCFALAAFFMETMRKRTNNENQLFIYLSNWIQCNILRDRVLKVKFKISMRSELTRGRNNDGNKF